MFFPITWLTALLYATPLHHSVAEIVAKFQGSTGLVTALNSRGEIVSQASGFFVTPDGKFVTNFHAIRDASSVTVKRPDGGFYVVSRLSATDPSRDLAILQVDGSGFTPVSLGVST